MINDQSVNMRNEDEDGNNKNEVKKIQAKRIL